MSILIGICTLLSTLFGGLFALAFKDKLHLILGFSAGAVLGVAFFDLMPEALTLGASAYGIREIVSIIAAGFICYMILDRFIDIHAHHETSALAERGAFGAGSFSIHSFLDGVAIGLAFHVSAAVGLVVAIAVVAHDFSDGINTVGIILKNKGVRASAFHWLVLDACAPLVGIISTFFFTISEHELGIVLALFSGFFLYIGASELLPESHHDHPTAWTSFATLLGAAVIYAAVRFAAF